MAISQLGIQHFRILSAVNFETSPQFNIFYGNNGSGKTSLLEAIYYLSSARSFRTTQNERIIEHHHEQFSIFAKLKEPGSREETVVGIQRGLDGSRGLRINGQKQAQLATIAKKLPCLMISTESYRFFHDGPKNRRQILDWGVFHVEQCFHPIWKEFQNALQQRNAAIKRKLPRQEIAAWDDCLNSTGNRIHEMRTEYVSRLQPILARLLKFLLRESDLTLVYSPGWDIDRDYKDQLQLNLFKDMIMGYTQQGPHRADITIHFNEVPAEDYLSQGQQKLASYAIKLAQGILMREVTGIQPIYLIDDLPSELDPTRKNFILHQLKELNAQVFVTSIEKKDLQDLFTEKNCKLFHVEHGQVSEKQKSPEEINPISNFH